MIEKAFFISNLLKRKSFDLIYIGSESCPNMALKHLKEFPFENKTVLTLPILCDKGLDSFNKMMDVYVKKGKLDEIVLNDIGSVIFFRKKYNKLKINIGRVLSLYFKKSYMYEKVLKNFVSDWDINGIELDDSDLAVKISNITRVHFHSGPSLSAVTRFCPWEKIWNSQKCEFSCFNKVKKLVSPKMDYDLYLKDCGYYGDKNKDFEKKFQRIVEHG
ncbi:MAG: hypothetical protein ACP5SD_00165 [Elusimicrobiales bacterium]